MSNPTGDALNANQAKASEAKATWCICGNERAKGCPAHPAMHPRSPDVDEDPALDAELLEIIKDSLEAVDAPADASPATLAALIYDALQGAYEKGLREGIRSASAPPSRDTPPVFFEQVAEVRRLTEEANRPPAPATPTPTPLRHVYDDLMNCINCGHPHVGRETAKYDTPCPGAPTHRKCLDAHDLFPQLQGSAQAHCVCGEPGCTKFLDQPRPASTGTGTYKSHVMPTSPYYPDPDQR
jgi:hypothetical protein